MSVCPHCGWYASMGTFVEIEQAWEEAAAGDEPAPQTTWEVWKNLVPVWGWIAAASCVAALGMSVVVRLAVADAGFRSVWSVTQLLVGGVLALGVHIVAFVMAAADDANIGVADLLISPFKAWARLLVQMPRRQWLLDGFVFAIAAMIGSTAIIGGIPYDRVWDWGYRAPAKQNLLNAISENAAAGGEDKSMEEAVGEFADKAAVSGGHGGAGAAAPAKQSAEKPQLQTTDALILGYTLNREGQLNELLIASEQNGKLRYAGRVQPKLSPDDALGLVRRFAASGSPRSLIPTPLSARWVQPRFPCRVSYTKRLDSGRLRGLKWEELLSEIRTFW